MKWKCLVAVFGDTTTDTEGGHEPNSITKKDIPITTLQQTKSGQKKKEAPPAAIVSPLIRLAFIQFKILL